MGNTPVKKPTAPSRKKRSSAPDLKAQIAGEIHIALERLGADEELLTIVGSWRDTLDDRQVLAMPGSGTRRAGCCTDHNDAAASSRRISRQGGSPRRL
jgi:hypothetical protein